MGEKLPREVTFRPTRALKGILARYVRNAGIPAVRATRHGCRVARLVTIGNLNYVNAAMRRSREKTHCPPSPRSDLTGVRGGMSDASVLAHASISA